MEKKKTEVKKKEVKFPEIKRSKRLISFREFLLGKPMREERKAAFEMFLNGEKCHSQEEWDKLYEEFEARS